MPLITEDGTGVYAIRNILNGKVYIGSAVCFTKRWCTHLSQLRRGVHHSRKLQNAWNKHGEESFHFERVLICSVPNMIAYEQIAIDAFSSFSLGYNSRPKAENNLGFKYSAESREKVAASKRGVKRAAFTTEHKAKLSEANKGKQKCLGFRHTESAKQNMRNRVITDSHRAAISASLVGNSRALGLKHTVETREKISSSLLGNTRRRGKTMPVEARERISAAHKGVPKSEETRRKMSEAAKRRWNKGDL